MALKTFSVADLLWLLEKGWNAVRVKHCIFFSGSAFGWKSLLLPGAPAAPTHPPKLQKTNQGSHAKCSVHLCVEPRGTAKIGPSEGDFQKKVISRNNNQVHSTEPRVRYKHRWGGGVRFQNSQPGASHRPKSVTGPMSNGGIPHQWRYSEGGKEGFGDLTNFSSWLFASKKLCFLHMFGWFLGKSPDEAPEKGTCFCPPPFGIFEKHCKYIHILTLHIYKYMQRSSLQKKSQKKASLMPKSGVFSAFFLCAALPKRGVPGCNEGPGVATFLGRCSYNVFQDVDLVQTPRGGDQLK